MVTSEKLSIIMAERIKCLREGKGLSHDKLSKALKERYGISISTDSLMNYEVTSLHHSKALKNQGMRAEYLRCLADFYNVSSDYLLGLSDVKSLDPNVSTVMQYTGLTESNVQLLHEPSHLGQTSPNNAYKRSFFLLVNDLIEMSQTFNIHIPYFQMWRLRTSFDGENVPAGDSVDRMIASGNAKRWGYAVLPVNESIAFYASQLSRSIEQAIVSKYRVNETCEPRGRCEEIEVNGRSIKVWKE